MFLGPENHSGIKPPREDLAIGDRQGTASHETNRAREKDFRDTGSTYSTKWTARATIIVIPYLQSLRLSEIIISVDIPLGCLHETHIRL